MRGFTIASTVGAFVASAKMTMSGYVFEYLDSSMSTDDICATSVGFKEDKNNDYCKQKCLDYAKANDDSLKGYLDNEETLEECFFQHYKGNNMDVCFNSISPFKVESIPDKYTRLGSAKTPAECQTLCQDDEACYRFVFTKDDSKCYGANLKISMSYFATIRYYDKYGTEVGDGFCAESDLDCYTDNFTCAKENGPNPIVANFPEDIVTGWQWCHPSGSPCEIPEAPMKNRYREMPLCTGDDQEAEAN